MTTEHDRSGFEKIYPVEGGYVLYIDGKYVPAFSHYAKCVEKAQRQQDRWEAWQHRQAEIDRLRDICRRYARHEKLCALVGGHDYCSCGLDEALAKQESK